MTRSERTTWHFATPGRLIFGNGAAKEVGPALRRLRLQRALIVTDQVLVNTGAAALVSQSLKDAGVTVQVCSEGEPEPSFQAVQRARDVAEEFKPDSIIGLGGGSNMDLAKTTAMFLAHGGTIRDYVGFDEVPGPIVPLICLPTTAGTGSEVSSAAVLTDKENQVKVAIMSPYFRPLVALVDPLLTLSCPKGATAASGIDALTHAIEAYLATSSSRMDVEPGQLLPYEGKHPLGDCLAERAIQLIGKHLIRAVEEPNHLPAREGMALGATIAGLAFSNCGVGLVHAMEYPLGGVLHVSHGEGNGLLLPHVMRFEMPARIPELAKINELLGDDAPDLTMEESAARAIATVERIQEAVGIRKRIRDLGGTEDQLPTFAAKAFAIKRLMALVPRPTTEADILEVYRQAF